MIGLLDDLTECKLHETKFTILQIGDKWPQRVQMSPPLSRANSRIVGFMQNETFFASCIYLNLHSSTPVMENM